MYPKKMATYAVGVLFVLVLFLAACQEEPDLATPETVEVTRIVTVEAPGDVETETVEVTRVVEVDVERPPDVIAQLPIFEAWQNSPHADAEAEAFRHWDEDDPAEVPESCAKCHSTPGFVDFLGADGSEFGVVDAPAPIGSVVECQACHNEVAQDLDSVTFPSGVTVVGLADEARCMQCHQGRASTVQVNGAIEEAGLTEDPDTVTEDVGFINIHYYAAAATQYGTLVMGGYEYDGHSYDARFAHVEPYDTCIDCHDPHTLEVQVEECTACHEGVTSVEDLVDVRTLASQVDYDGDGDVDEGVYYEIETLRDMLYTAMQSYGEEVAGSMLVYDEASYPYFFNDAGERYGSWTPRLVRAAYNYQVSLKDPGRYAHGGKYIIQLLYDSIEDLNEALTEPVDLSNARRIDHGHFAGSEEAFRHWDEEGAVPASCATCHSADGLPLFLAEGVQISQDLSNGFKCSTCHSSLETFERYVVEEVEFPSGAVLSTGDPDSNICLNCHQGRESTVSVNNSIGELGDDETSENLRFRNIHYFAAGATLFGGEASGAYQFAGNEYAGRFEHVGAFDSCVECHSTHALEVEIEACSNCHEGVEGFDDLQSIRISEVDYDGDGDATEGIAMEIQTMEELLYAAMQDYAANTVGTAIVYDSHSYPYYFIDTNGNGEADPDEANFGNQFNAWTPRLLRAAYNYQYAQKDPGDFAHNAPYIIQVLYDSIEHLGADVSGLTRPDIPTPDA